MVPGSSGLLFSVREDGPGTQSSKRTVSQLSSFSGNPNGTHRRGLLPRQGHRWCSLLRSEVLVCSIENWRTLEWTKDGLSMRQLKALGVHLSSLESGLIL